jgi:hypothetical protein
VSDIPLFALCGWAFMAAFAALLLYGLLLKEEGDE